MDEYIRPNDHEFSPQVFFFYTCASVAMAGSLYNVVIPSFLIVNAQGLMLRGPPDAVHHCVHVLASNWLVCRVWLVLSISSSVIAALSLLWIKGDSWMQADEDHPAYARWQNADWKPLVITLGEFAFLRVNLLDEIPG